jgi:hypothetical protein
VADNPNQSVDGLLYSLTNQAPIDPEVITIFEEFRVAARPLAEAFFTHVPSSRERAVAIHELEEAIMWGIKAIAVHQEDALAMRHGRDADLTG